MLKNILFNRNARISKNDPAGQSEKINCPFCNSDQAIIFSSRADIVTCSSCGIIYLRTRPTPAAMYELYQAYAHETSHMRLPDDVPAAKQAGLRRKYLVDEIIETNTTNRKGVWLDVGCGWGALLDEVRDRGYKPKGVELTRNSLDFAAMQLDIPVSNSPFLDSRIENSSCSIVSMVHVLEHLPYPKPTIEKIYTILEEGGMFCGIVPNIASFCSKYLKDQWEWLDPYHHYVHYSPQTLTRVLVDAGFVVEKIYTTCGDYNHNAVIECISRNLPGIETPEKAQELLSTLEANGKGEEIRFFARKKNTQPIEVTPVKPTVEKIFSGQICPCCDSVAVELFRQVSGYDYFQCLNCGSLFIDTEYLSKIDKGFNIVKYEEGYWNMELASAKQRSYGPALARMAEAIYYCKRPIKKFLDIGTGPGYFLDAIAKLLPDHADVFYGVELFPPDVEFRTRSKNYITDDLGNLTDKFDCGICVEVVEHITPFMLKDLLKKLADKSNPDALYIFNTGMPEYVINEDPAYLDPTKRGHICIYSLKAMSLLAGKYGFTVHQIIGKTWAYVLEFTNNINTQPEDIRDRIWKASEHNLNILSDSVLGDALKILGMETSRAYS